MNSLASSTRSATRAALIIAQAHMLRGVFVPPAALRAQFRQQQDLAPDSELRAALHAQLGARVTDAADATLFSRASRGMQYLHPNVLRTHFAKAIDAVNAKLTAAGRQHLRHQRRLAAPQHLVGGPARGQVWRATDQSPGEGPRPPVPPDSRGWSVVASLLLTGWGARRPPWAGSESGRFHFLNRVANEKN